MLHLLFKVCNGSEQALSAADKVGNVGGPAAVVVNQTPN